MEILNNLSPQVEATLQTSGGPLEISGQQGQYVVMRLDVYNSMIGISEEEEAETLASVRRGLADVDAGRTIPLDEAFAILEKRYAT